MSLLTTHHLVGMISQTI